MTSLGAPSGPPFSQRALLWYFLRLGTLGFGGPIALAAAMQRDLVEGRHWITPAEYKEGLAFSQLAPGPLAAQLAMYLGWVRAGVGGATLVGLAFVGPSFVMVLVLAALYLRYSGLAWMQGAFYGVAAAVIAIVAHGGWKLARRTVGRDYLLWVLVAVNAAATVRTETEVVWLFVASGLLVLMIRSWSSRKTAHITSWFAAVLALPTAGLRTRLPESLAWLTSGFHGEASLATLARIGWFFAKSGAVVFGSGLAIVPFLHGGVVTDTHWLTERQFLDAVAVSMLTPGPVVITVAFIGYLVAGPLGGVVAAAGVFLPVYLFVTLVARRFHDFAGNTRVKAVVDGVTAAATGAILGAVVVLGRRALIDLPTVLICLTVLALVLSVKRLPEPVLIIIAAAVGIAITNGGSARAQSASAPLRVVADIPIPGPAVRFDYQSFDSITGRLYISHMGAGRLVVFDTRANRVVASIPGFRTATGVLAVPAEHRVYVSAAGEHEVVVVNDETLQVVGRAGGIRFPDGIAYDPEHRKVYVSDEAGGVDVVIDAQRDMQVATIALGGEAGNTHYDPIAHRILVAVQTRNQLVAIDPATDRITERYEMPCSHPHGFLIDAPHRVAFVSCEGDARLLVVDLRTMSTTATYHVGDDPDVLALDPGLGRLYVAAESGVVSVFDEHGNESRNDRTLALVSRGELRAAHAHSVAVDPATHRVYLPLQDVNGRPVLRVLEPVVAPKGH